MVNVVREFTVKADPAAVVDYLKDFSHAEEWDPGTVSCTRKDSGEIAVGSQWDNTSKLLGNTTSLVYELEELRPDGVKFRGTNAQSVAYDIIDVAPAPEGAKVRYEADITLKGVAKLADPALKILFEAKVAKEVVEELTRVLESL